MKVYLIEHHETLRELLTQRLSATPGIRVVGGCGSAELAMADIARLDPHIAIICDDLPDGDVLSVCWHLGQVAPRLRVVVHTAVADPSDTWLAELLGVSAWVVKQIRIGPLTQALRAMFCELLIAERDPSAPWVARAQSAWARSQTLLQRSQRLREEAVRQLGRRAQIRPSRRDPAVPQLVVPRTG